MRRKLWWFKYIKAPRTCTEENRVQCLKKILHGTQKQPLRLIAPLNEMAVVSSNSRLPVSQDGKLHIILDYVGCEFVSK
jgi:hypothetical protein